jgi:tetratricopeptide (TPR) repeat protein/transglutaminase-like putative cysteine protease
MRLRSAPLTSFLLFAFLATGASAADKTKLQVFHALGGTKASGNTIKGLEQYYDGATDEAIATLTKASKNNTEHAAMYALSQHALAMNEHQKALELLCKSFSAAGNSAWAEFYLEEIADVLPMCSDPKPFETMVKQAEDSKTLRAHLLDLVRATQGEWLMETGQFSAASQAYKRLQFVTHWSLAGPFDNRDKAGFATAYEPESLIDLQKSIPARGRRVAWYQPAAQPFDGRMILSELFEPRVHALAYAVTFAKAEEAGWAVLRAGFGGAGVVWVNGEKAGSVDQYNDYGIDKIAAPVYLHKGWNQILVKTGIVEGMEWAYSLRLCKTDGGPYPGLTIDPSATALAAYSSESKNRKVPSGAPANADLGLLHDLQKALEQEPNNISLQAAYGVLLDVRNMGEKEEQLAPKQLAKAIELAPRCAYLKLAMAAISDDSNEARHAAESAWELNSKLPGALTELAHLAGEAHQHLVATDYARQIRAAFGPEKMGQSALVMAGALAEPRARSRGRGRNGQRSTTDDLTRGFRSEAYRLAQEFTETHPYFGEGWQRLAELEDAGSARRAALLKGLSFCGGNEKLRQSYAIELSATGKQSETAEIMLLGLQAEPFSVSAAMNVARQYYSSGNAPRSMQVLEEIRKTAPESPELLTALAVGNHQAGRTAEAVELYREVLRLKPNSPQVKDYLAALDKQPGAEQQKFYAPYDIALKDLKIPQASAYPDDNIIHLLNQQVVRVNANGTSSRMVHRISKLLRPNGVQQLQQDNIWYEPDRQVVDVIKASVITPDGREISRAEIDDRSTSAAMGVQTRIYDEHFLKQVRFKNLEPGAIVDLQYTIRDTGDNIYGNYFADTFYFNDDDPTVRSQYVLDFPKDLSQQTQVINAKIDAQRVAQSDTRREVYKWEHENAPGIPQERGMPPVVDQLAQLQVTTMKSWQEVGQWYWNLAKDQLVPSDEMRREVKEITKDCKNDTEKLRTVHDWVIRKIRYLGIEFGRNGYRPHKASESFKALYGDCKDTATLITSMLQTVDIPCDLVLIRTVDAGAVPGNSLPMPNLFNHCIAHVPKVDGKEYWIDCTTDFHRLGEVPDADQTAQVLLINSGGGNFVKIPGSAPLDNLVEQQFKAKVAKSGAATLELYDIRHGQFAPAYRQLAETPGQYERYMKDFAAKRYNGAEVEKLELAPAQEQGPMWMKATLKAPALATQSGERMVLPASLDALYLSLRYAGQSSRKHPLELHFPWARKMEVVYELEKGAKVSALPEEAEIKESFGKYSRKVKQQDGTLKIEENFELSQQRIDVPQYEAFRLFCNKIDSLMDQKVLFEAK